MTRRRPDFRLVETPADRDEPVISFPRAPDEAANPAFPWLMMVAPAVMGIGLVLMTGAAYGLMFAAFGPLLALGTVIDQSVQRRRRLRAADLRFARDLDDCERLVAARIRRERQRRLQQRPPVRELLTGRADAPPGEPVPAGAALPVALGTTTVPSAIRLDAPAGPLDARVADLLRQARTIEGVPHVEELRICAIVGSPELVLRAALGMLIDLLTHTRAHICLNMRGASVRRLVAAEVVRAGLHGAGVRLLLDAHHTAEAPGCDHPSNEGARRMIEEAAEIAFTLAFVDEGMRPPADADATVELVSADEAMAVRGARAVRVRPQLASPLQFQQWARDHVTARREQGFGDTHAVALPDACDSDELLRRPPPMPFRGDGTHLAAPIGIGIDGPVWVDLVSDGPHAVIGGTTGTGKSELLRGWIASIAARYPATHVAFLCIDFKGGATFDAIAGLPHCVGVVTDLDGDEAVRVLAGLRAELRRREHELRRLAARDIGALEPGRLERLVVVVDEFQALMDDHRELHDGFADLAARGRSLGIHVILCAQRPAGAARESLLANCTIRLSLRVTNAADSHAVIGSGDAALLPAEPRGRAVLSTGEGSRAVQVARPSDDLLDRVSERRSAELVVARRPRPIPPWLPPLPMPLAPEAFRGRFTGVSHDAVPIALVDDPEHQRQPLHTLDARGGAHLVILGPSRSGKSTALSSIHDQLARASVEVIRVPADIEGAWDALVQAANRDDPGPVVVIIDDLDERATAFDDEHRHVWLDLVRDTARLGGTRKLTLVATLSRVAGEHGAIVGLARDVIRLGSPSRQEFTMSGGDAPDYRANLPPGRGVHGGLVLQFPAAEIRMCPESIVRREPMDVAMLARTGAAIVTRRPLDRTAQLAALGITTKCVPTPGGALAPVGDGGAAAAGSITLGEPDEWRQSYGSLSRFAARTSIVFDDLPPLLARGLLPGEPLLPPVANPAAVVLVRAPNREVTRFAWAAPER